MRPSSVRCCSTRHWRTLRTPRAFEHPPRSHPATGCTPVPAPEMGAPTITCHRRVLMPIAVLCSTLTVRCPSCSPRPPSSHSPCGGTCMCVTILLHSEKADTRGTSVLAVFPTATHQRNPLNTAKSILHTHETLQTRGCALFVLCWRLVASCLTCCVLDGHRSSVTSRVQQPRPASMLQASVELLVVGGTGGPTRCTLPLAFDCCVEREACREHLPACVVRNATRSATNSMGV